MVITAYSHASATYKVRTSYWACRGRRGEPHRHNTSKPSSQAAASGSTRSSPRKHRQRRQRHHPSDRQQHSGGNSNCPRWRNTSSTYTR
ncbi:protein E12A [Proboscivirus elephantidbeta4]|uniref:Protein E12A n=1 Tax=Elephant endotheliotropic herpesvirus 4 TaxID=548914 RepID=A0A0S1TPC0_9BETA|nr:protein E12A [Elephant endotheliotropic herpesvirus 4]ALM26034.1 protein E12A [Elephant endotheliotropic herpesvirus 4]ALN42243.1 protein E12A [Elephant endotheliotropic herpesvirus 4]